MIKIDPKNEVAEVKKLGEGFAAAAFTLAGALPALLLGGMAGAIARHPEIEAQLRGEFAYNALILWGGGTFTFSVALLLSGLFVFYKVFVYGLWKAGWVNRHRSSSRKIDAIVKFLMTPMITTLAFGAGLVWGPVLQGEAGMFVLFTVLFFFGYIHYILATTER